MKRAIFCLFAVVALTGGSGCCCLERWLCHPWGCGGCCGGGCGGGCGGCCDHGYDGCGCGSGDMYGGGGCGCDTCSTGGGGDGEMYVNNGRMAGPAFAGGPPAADPRYAKRAKRAAGGPHPAGGHPLAHQFRNSGHQYEFAAGPPAAQVTYPYYTTHGPRDFLAKNPPSLGPY